jgi:hypothetical protein
MPQLQAIMQGRYLHTRQGGASRAAAQLLHEQRGFIFDPRAGWCTTSA